jgi:hypothetical protein
MGELKANDPKSYRLFPYWWAYWPSDFPHPWLAVFYTIKVYPNCHWISAVARRGPTPAPRSADENWLGLIWSVTVLDHTIADQQTRVAMALFQACQRSFRLIAPTPTPRAGCPRMKRLTDRRATWASGRLRGLHEVVRHPFALAAED